MTTEQPRTSLLIVLALLLAGAPLAYAEKADQEIENILRARIDVSRRGVGIVVGVLDESGPRTISYGVSDQNGGNAVDGNSVFEIGSITKVFTATLLADMVQRGEVGLNDPISKYLPKSVKTPKISGKEITLLNLARHTSGLPQMPGNLTLTDIGQPYGDYTVKRLYEDLGSYRSKREIGAYFEYSNYGFGLLGIVLSRRARMDYGALVQARILRPLNMNSSGTELTPSMRERLSAGHSETLAPAPNWEFQALAGAGAMYSTANDLLKFVAANLAPGDSPLSMAMKKTHQTDEDRRRPDLNIGLGWFRTTKFDTEIVWHAGGALGNGYKTFIGLDKERRKGVVVLSNSDNDIRDIGFHILESRSPVAILEPPIRQPVVVQLDERLLEEYVGVYRLDPKTLVVISRKGGRLFGRLTGQPPYELLAESESTFLVNIVGAQISFIRDKNGKASELQIHQSAGDLAASRLTGRVGQRALAR